MIIHIIPNFIIKKVDTFGPHTSERMISSMPLALLSLLGNVFFVLFPFAHTLHIPSCFVWNYRRPSIDLLAIGSVL